MSVIHYRNLELLMHSYMRLNFNIPVTRRSTYRPYISMRLLLNLHFSSLYSCTPVLVVAHGEHLVARQTISLFSDCLHWLNKR